MYMFVARGIPRTTMETGRTL